MQSAISILSNSIVSLNPSNCISKLLKIEILWSNTRNFQVSQKQINGISKQRNYQPYNIPNNLFQPNNKRLQSSIT